MVDYEFAAETTQGRARLQRKTAVTPATSLASDPPPVILGLLQDPPPQPRSWVRTVGPAILGVVVWFPLLDGLGGVAPGAGVPRRWLSCLLALGAFYLLIYLPLAGLGLRRRARLPVVAADALGERGAEWIAGVLYGLFAALWGAVAIWYSVRLTLDGLTVWGLLDPPYITDRVAMGATLEPPLVLACLVWWTFIAVSATGLNLTGVIEALMRVYSPTAGVLIVVTALWVWWRGGTGFYYQVDWMNPAAGPGVFPYLFGALAFAGVSTVEWGGAVRDRRDVRLGGWTALLAAGAVTTLAALVLGSYHPDGTARRTLIDLRDRWLGGGALLLFGLASLAPACYAASLFTTRFRAHWPRLGKWKGVGLLYLILIVPGAVGVAGDVVTLAGVSGALFAPLAGILGVESFRKDRDEPRRGWNGPGVAAWAVGAVVGLAPTVAPTMSRIQPAALFGWFVAALVYANAPRRRGERST